ncbi:MAG: permease [Planctomycetota bacterium]|nr:permease [Planctomycetota bacterium]
MAGIALAFVGAAFLLPFLAPDNETVRNFSVIFSSIILEAMPFMLLGTLIGGLIEVFVSRERMDSLSPNNSLASACLAAGMGVIFPVCECAIVPVVRRLAGKGLPAAAAIAYLLAGPMVNPVVGFSTAMAYNLDWRPVVVRLGFGYVIAVGVALLMERFFARSSLFVPEIAGATSRHAHGHDHSHEPPKEPQHDHGHGCGCGCGKTQGTAGKMVAACNHALDDFMATAPFLVAGAALATVAQVCLERRLFVDLASSPLASSAVMMLLAVLLNLCSEADAFIAASFQGLVPFSAQMAFLVIGPMFDIKLLLMYRNLFKAREIPLLAALVSIAVLLMSALLEVLGVGI